MIRTGTIALFALLSGAARADGPSEPAAAAPESSRVEYEILAEYAEEDSLSPLRYLADGQVTLNDRCPVRLSRLNRRMEPVWVNGRAIGFC